MPINYYVGTDGPTISVVTVQELYEAIDILHTQVCDWTEEGALTNVVSPSPEILEQQRESLKSLEVMMKSLEQIGADPTKI